MEGAESLLDSILEENLEEEEDVEMLDVEEGELVQLTSKVNLKQNNSADIGMVNEKPPGKNKRSKRNRKKNKRKRGGSGSGPNITDINRFVQDVCKRLREKKTYLVWAAVGQLGLSALRDLVNEVDAIQKCGGQKTADGKRFRTGGGILWSVLKLRDSTAYKEIMKKGKEFEKQLKQQCLKKPPVPNEKDSSQNFVNPIKDQATTCETNDSQLVSFIETQTETLNIEQGRPSVHDRLRVPVTYDDVLAEGSGVE